MYVGKSTCKNMYCLVTHFHPLQVPVILSEIQVHYKPKYLYFL